MPDTIRLHEAESHDARPSAAELGAFICRGRTPNAPPILLYALTLLCGFFGGGLTIGCMSMVTSYLPAERQGGYIGVGIGLVILLFGAVTFHSGRSRRYVNRVDFFQNGIAVWRGSHGERWFYSQLVGVNVTVIRPASWWSPMKWFLLILAVVGIHSIDDRGITSFEHCFGGGRVSVLIVGQQSIEVVGPGYRRLEYLGGIVADYFGPHVVDRMQAA